MKIMLLLTLLLCSVAVFADGDPVPQCPPATCRCFPGPCKP